MGNEIEVGVDDTELESIDSTEAEVDTDDSGLDATPADDQVADDEEAQTQDTLDDDPRVQAKLKNLEAGYQKKYQTLAEERRQLEAAKAEIAKIQGQAQQPQGQQANPDDPWLQHDWNLVQPEVRTVAEQTYAMQQEIMQLKQIVLGQIAPTIQETALERQKAALQAEYGDAYNEASLMELHKSNPNVPLEYVAALAFKDGIREQAAKKTYANVQAKRTATSPTPTGAKTVADVDTKNWSIRDFYKHAKQTGGKL